MSANGTIGWLASKLTLASMAWLAKKGVGLLIVYVGLGSVFQSIQGGSTAAAALYVLLSVFGIYLLAKW